MIEAAASQPDAETLRGRGRVYVVPRPGGGGRWVVRHYHRGGAVAPILGDRYLRLGTPRPVRELETARALLDRGIPTPAPVAAAVYPAGLFYRGDFVTEHVPGSRDLAAVLFEDDDGSGADSGDGEIAAMREAGRLLRLLHERGVRHPDLNLKNVLIRGGGPAPVEALVLDVDGVRIGRGVGGRARRRMLARFWRSARKWEGRTGRRVPAAARRAFEAGYGD